MIDRQSVNTTEQEVPEVTMPARKVRGRIRHIVVDTQGWLLAVVVHPADIQDRDGAKLVLQRMAGLFPDLRPAVG